MTAPPAPETIYHRARDEGRRRLSMPLLEQMATGFIVAQVKGR